MQRKRKKPPPRRFTIEELSERHFGLAAPAEIPQFQDDNSLDTSEVPVL